MPFIHVKQWVKFNYGKIFRLTDKSVQICLKDKTQLVLSNENNFVIYINKKGEKTKYQFKNAMNSDNEEMVKKLKFAKDILINIFIESKKEKNGKK
jgi:polo-like kinase 1